MLKTIGIVKNILGEVIAIQKDGDVRDLKNGDEVNLGEVIISKSEDGGVWILLHNGKKIILTGKEKVLLDESGEAKIINFNNESNVYSDERKVDDESKDKKSSSEHHESKNLIQSYEPKHFEAGKEANVYANPREVEIHPDEPLDILQEPAPLPAIMVDAPDGVQTDTTPLIKGSTSNVPQGSEILLSIVDSEGILHVVKTTTDENGNYSVEVPEHLPEGKYKVTAKVIDPQGNEASNQDIGEIDIAPAISVDTPAPSEDTTPLIKGHASNVPKDSIITLIITDSEGNTQTITTKTDENGDYEIEVPKELAPGDYKVDASVKDPQGNEANENDTGVITTPPIIPEPQPPVPQDPTITVDAPDGIQQDQTPTIKGHASNVPKDSVVTLVITDSKGDKHTITTKTDENGDYQVDVPDNEALPEGKYTVDASVKDPQGKEATAQDPGEIDLLPTIIVDAPDEPSEDTTPLIKGSTTNVPKDSIVTLVITDNKGHKQTLKVPTDENGKYEIEVPNKLAAGEYQVDASVSDPQNNKATHQDTGEIIIPKIEVADAQTFEGKELVHDVTLTIASKQARTYDFELSNGSAIGGKDFDPTNITFTKGVTYDPVNSTITVPANVKEFQVKYPTIDDPYKEDNETTKITIDKSTAIGTIKDETNPYDPNTQEDSYDPANPTKPIDPDTPANKDAVFVSIEDNIDDVHEDENGVFEIVLKDKNGNEIEATEDVVVNLTYENTDPNAAIEGARKDFIKDTQVTIPKGSSKAELDIKALADNIAGEEKESVKIKIDNASSDGFEEVLPDENHNKADMNIIDQTKLPELVIDDASLVEQNGEMTFTIKLVGPKQEKEVSVDWETFEQNPISAQDGKDYDFAKGSVTFTPGQREKTITVPIKDDALKEGDETFEVVLNNPVNATLKDDVGVGTILDESADVNTPEDHPHTPENPNQPDDPTKHPKDPVYVSIKDSVDEVYEGQKAKFPIELRDENGNLIEASEDIKVKLQYTSTTADDTDYTKVEFVTIKKGFDSALLDIKSVDDSLSGETNENVKVQILEVVTPQADTGFEKVLIDHGVDQKAHKYGETDRPKNKADFTIVDKDPIPKLTIDDQTINEQDGTMTFTITRKNDSAQTVSVDYDVRDLNFDETDPDKPLAKSGKDYEATSGTLTFEQGEMTKTITVKIKDDALAEGDEDFQVVLSNAKNALITDEQGIGTIKDETADVDTPENHPHTEQDPNLPEDPTKHPKDSVFVSIEDEVTKVHEGEAGTFPILLKDKNGNPIEAKEDVEVTLTYTGTDGNGVDYQATTTVTIPKGSHEAKLDINALPDDIANEDLETVSVKIDSATSRGFEAVTPDPQHKTADMDIIDQTPLPKLVINDQSMVEKDGFMEFTISIDGPQKSDKPISVDFETFDQNPVSAHGGKDYESTKGTATIPAGETSTTIRIPIKDDALKEGDETFDVVLKNAKNAVIKDAKGVGTITEETTAYDPNVTEDPNDPNTPTNQDPVFVNIKDDVIDVKEGHKAHFPITLTDKNGNPVEVPEGKSVTVEVEYSGVGKNGEDFVGVTKVTIPEGQSQVNLNIATLDDDIVENSELVNIQIKNPQDNGAFESIQTQTDTADLNIIDENVELLDSRVVVSEEGLEGGMKDDTIDNDGNVSKTHNKEVIASDISNKASNTIDMGGEDGADSAGVKYSFATQNGANSGLTSKGERVIWDKTSENELVGKTANGDEILKVALDQNTGETQVDLLKPIDHDINGVEDIIETSVKIKGEIASKNYTKEVELQIVIEDDMTKVEAVEQSNTVQPIIKHNIMLAIDFSGSMFRDANNKKCTDDNWHESRFYRTKMAILEMLDNCNEETDMINMVAFVDKAATLSEGWVSVSEAKEIVEAKFIPQVYKDYLVNGGQITIGDELEGATLKNGELLGGKIINGTDIGRGYTNYDAALNLTMQEYKQESEGHERKKVGAVDNRVYFITDGSPSYGDGNTDELHNIPALYPKSDHGIQAKEQQDWEQFLKDYDINSKAYAVNAEQGQLDPVAYDGRKGGIDTDGRVFGNTIDDEGNEISGDQQLMETLVKDVAANVVKGDSIASGETNFNIKSVGGADGAKEIEVTMLGKTYTYNVADDKIYLDGKVVSTNHQITIDTPTNSKFTLDFNTGKFTYKADYTMFSEFDGAGSEVINLKYKITDNDGDVIRTTSKLTFKEGMSLNIDSGDDEFLTTAEMGAGVNCTLQLPIGLRGGDSISIRYSKDGTYTPVKNADGSDKILTNDDIRNGFININGLDTAQASATKLYVEVKIGNDELGYKTANDEVTIHNKVPQVSITDINERGVSDVIVDEDGTLNIKGTVADADGNDVHVVISDGGKAVGGSASVDASGSWNIENIDIQGLDVGKLKITAHVTDDIGQEADSTPVEILKDDKALIIDHGDNIDLANLHDIQSIDLSNNNQNDTLNLSLNDVIEITDNSNVLKITGDNTDKVTLTQTEGWQNLGEANGYTQYEITTDTSYALLEIKNDVIVELS